ncbi:hypothetical protein LuPra_00825 [Luteitalea pratensis]|uniref:Uncharacterized protein n=1 Tax=Luteitalea pratensis TaxID=1855912 RepID=A0A143PGK5_LUTPR|nr:hypothetical protein LuPra_00825 [Luteitalea pratensis]
MVEPAPRGPDAGASEWRPYLRDDGLQRGLGLTAAIVLERSRLPW